MNKKRIRQVLLLLLLSLLLLYGGVVYAASGTVPKTGTLVVQPKNHYSGKDHYGEGAQLSLYQVADATVGAIGIDSRLTYSLTDEFKKFRIDFDSIRPDGIDTTYTSELITYIQKNHIQGKTFPSTDKMGRGFFLDLKPGLYLVVQTGASSDYTAKYKYIQPFCVSIPILDTIKKKWQYDVTVCPKLESIEKPKPEEDNNQSSGNTPHAEDTFEEETETLPPTQEPWTEWIGWDENGEWVGGEWAGGSGGGWDSAVAGDSLAGGVGGDRADGLPQTGLMLLPILILIPLGFLLLGVGIWQIFGADLKKKWQTDHKKKKTYNRKKEQDDRKDETRSP